MSESPDPEELAAQTEEHTEPEAPSGSSKKRKPKQSTASGGSAKRRKVDDNNIVDQTEDPGQGSVNANAVIESPRSATPRKAALNHSVVGLRRN